METPRYNGIIIINFPTTSIFFTFFFIYSIISTFFS